MLRYFKTKDYHFKLIQFWDYLVQKAQNSLENFELSFPMCSSLDKEKVLAVYSGKN